MNDFNKRLFSLGISDVVERYVKHYFDLHGDILPVNGLYPFLMKEMEKPLIQVALKHLKGNQVKTAKLLGMNRNTLRRKIINLNIRFEQERDELDTRL